MPAALNIFFLAAEAEPFVKIGGLADVAGSLPLALRGLPIPADQDAALDVRLVLPLHRAMRMDSAALAPLVEFSVARQTGAIPARAYQLRLGGMPVYFISGEPVSAVPTVYSMDLAQDREKYAFFSLAALELARRLDWRPDILHANDWHTALAIYSLRSGRAKAYFERTRSVISVHNLPYMGGDGTDVLAAYDLPPLEEETLPAWALTQPLPLGLWAADALVPVSPTYAGEILTSEFGCGLEVFLRSRSGRMTGILNGLDVVAWDPATDPDLSANFSPANLSSRASNKAALQKRLGLDENARLPLLAMVGRMDFQKGVDITLEALRQLNGRAWQFVILGSSDPVLENAARSLQESFPERVRAVIGYEAQLSHLIYGGADMFLMPSRYEPCGLAQMIAMRYGSVPVVHSTGGLKDTVQEGRNGFLFPTADAAAMLEALDRAFSIFDNPAEWERIQRNGMQEDFSWPRSAAQYSAIYHALKKGDL